MISEPPVAAAVPSAAHYLLERGVAVETGSPPACTYASPPAAGMPDRGHAKAVGAPHRGH